jgi:hypothetical protein
MRLGYFCFANIEISIKKSALLVCDMPIGHKDSVGLSVCKVNISATIDGVFTPKLLLPAVNVGQQQRALMIYSENVQL